jgi:PKHD-type hydroxylase
MIFIRTIKNFLSQEECSEIIDRNDSDLEKSMVYDPSKGLTFDDYRISKQKIIDIPLLKNKILDFVNNEFKIKGFEIEQKVESSFQFTKYESLSQFDWHSDVDKIDSPDRFCTVVIQLNDDYEGGKLLYKKENNNEEIEEFERGTGNMFIFNSSLEHKVAPIINGTRYSLVCWLNLKKTEINKTLL